MSSNVTDDVHPPSNSSVHSGMFHCSDGVGLYMVSTLNSAYVVLVLPLSLFVLYLGVQQWRRRRSAPMSHSDFLTCNMAVVELVAVFGYVTYFCDGVPAFLGPFFGFFAWFGQMLFPILTCVERYLAVVHPVTYMGLKQAGGVRIRNLTTGCAWLVCCVGSCSLVLLAIYDGNLLPAISMLILYLVAMTFLSLSVLRVLMRPRPGKVGGDRVQVDQSKQRAFNTIMVIMGVLWLKVGGNVITIIIRSCSKSPSVMCAGEAATFVFSLPSSLVLFLLFLHRAGKLPNCRHKT